MANDLSVFIVPFADYWSKLYYLNNSFTEALHTKHVSCGYAAYIEKYLQFPPPEGPFPVLTNPLGSSNSTCDLLDDILSAILAVNPCWNPYHITDMCPHLWSVLGIIDPGNYSPQGEVVYFNRTDVQKAINAPVGTNWMQCTNINIFGGPSDNQSITDTSVGPAQNGVLAKVIEYTNNTIICIGNLDAVLPTNGTLMVLQNVTWKGLQGFQEFPGEPFYVPYHPEYNDGSLAEAGIVGLWGSERGLTFYQVQLAGHELPGYAPGSAYRMLEKLLGRIPSLDERSDFTTQTGNFTTMSTLLRGKRGL
jgi:carboxypeptidase D